MILQTSVNLNIFADDRLIDPDKAWENTEIRGEFTEDVDIFETPFDDLDDKTAEEFIHHINDIQPLSLNIDYDISSDIDVSGTIIKDRKVAFKILKFLKDFGKNHGGFLEDVINKLTVNDLYQN